MQDEVRAFGMELGHRVLGRDWTGVHLMLAPWLRRALRSDAIRRFFEDAYRDVLTANGIERMHYPEFPDPELDGNHFTNATSLRAPLSWKPGYQRPVPDEVGDDNMRYWLCMRLLCSDAQMQQLDFDCFAEVWMAVVQTDEGLRVGYWSHGAY